MKNNDEQSIVYIDEQYKKKLDKMKTDHKEDPHHYLNRLELKEIFIFSVILALKYKYKPQKSKKRCG